MAGASPRRAKKGTPCFTIAIKKQIEVANMKYDYLIVGAGLFGTVFAHEAVRRGKTCLVADKREHIGGNVYTAEIGGIQVHKYGAHIFHTNDKEVWEYVNRFAEFNRFTNAPVANYLGEIFNLPFNMNTFYKLWGVSCPQEALRIIEGQRLKTAEPKNLEEQALSMVGRDIYEKLIKGYTQKQWGRECTELPAFIIKRLPLRFTFDNSYFNDCFQGIPIGGYTQIIEKMLTGCDVRLGTDYFSCRAELDGLAKKTVYTGMTDEYFGFRFGRLEYRSLRFENETLDRENFQGVAVVNYTDAATPYTRIIEHKHFEFGTQPQTVITREYPKEFTQGDEPYYPINDDFNNELYAKYRKLADAEKNVIFGGRLADYKYYDMWQVVRNALDAAVALI
jgi:UDP-galactopyranose mutase